MSSALTNANVDFSGVYSTFWTTLWCNISRTSKCICKSCHRTMENSKKENIKEENIRKSIIQIKNYNDLMIFVIIQKHQTKYQHFFESTHKKIVFGLVHGCTRVENKEKALMERFCGGNVSLLQTNWKHYLEAFPFLVRYSKRL